MLVRDATAADVPALAAQNDRYMRETFGRAWGGSAAQLAADLAAGAVAIAIAIAEPSRGGEPLGFVAWQPAYDLHHCVRGATVCDLFVEPAARGRGVAPALIAHACARIAASGGVYLSGLAVPGASRLYARVAWSWPTEEFILGGRAFRHVASLAGASPRALARALPDPAWNHQP